MFEDVSGVAWYIVGAQKMFLLPFYSPHIVWSTAVHAEVPINTANACCVSKGNPDGHYGASMCARLSSCSGLVPRNPEPQP